MILNRLNEALRKSPDPAMTLSGFVKEAQCIQHKEPVLYAGLLKAAVSYVGKDFLVDRFLDAAWPRDISRLQKQAGQKVKRSEILTHIGQDLGSFIEKHAHAFNKHLFSNVIPELKKQGSLDSIIVKSKREILGKPTVEEKLKTNPTGIPSIKKLAAYLSKKKKYLT